MNEIKELKEDMLRDLNKAQQEYIDALKKENEMLKKNIEVYKNSMKKGMVFIYENNEAVFIPVFFEPLKQLLVIDGYTPKDCKLNFTTNDLKAWINKCSSLIEKD